MRVYIAGKIGTKSERDFLESIERLCRAIGFDTFLPHRDVGLARSHHEARTIFKGDIEDGLAKCDVVVASLEGLHVGAGTAWEMGYAYAQGKPLIGIKMDESPEDGFEYLSSIIIASTTIVRSLDELKKVLGRLV